MLETRKFSMVPPRVSVRCPAGSVVVSRGQMHVVAPADEGDRDGRGDGGFADSPLPIHMTNPLSWVASSSIRSASGASVKLSSATVAAVGLGSVVVNKVARALTPTM